MGSSLTHERLLEVLDYDPETGIFLRKRTGRVAGSVAARSYWVIKVDGVSYYGHRLAWFYVYGAWPNGDLDHRNGDKIANQITNLREATESQNGANRGKATVREHSSKLKGVYWHKCRNRWRSSVMVRGQVIDLGYFDTEDEAHRAYSQTLVRHFGEFARAA